MIYFRKQYLNCSLQLHKKKHKKFALIASVSNLHHYIANLHFSLKLHVYHEILKIYQLKPEKGRPLV